MFPVHASKRLELETAVFDTDSGKMDAAVERGTQTVGNLEEGLDWATQISICTPDDRHTEIAIAAAEQELHILCEKPLTAPGVDRSAILDALAIQQAVHKVREDGSDIHFLVGTSYRLSPAFRYVREMYLAGQLGNVTRAYASYMHDMGEFYNEDGARHTP